MISKTLVVLALTLSCACWPSTARGQAAAPIDRDAMSALDKIGAYLRTLKAFQIRSITALDEVLDNGR